MSEYPLDWIISNLGAHLTETKERAGDSSSIPYSVSKVLGIVPQSEKFNKRVASSDISNYKVIREGDFAYDPMLLWDGSINRMLREGKGAVSPAYVTFRVTSNTLDADYLLHLLKANTTKTFYKSISKGTNVRRQKAEFCDFAGGEFAFPPLPEQKKIAEILSGIDFAVSSIQKKIDKLRSAKVALAESELIGEHHSNQANSEIGFIPSHWQVKGILEVSSVASGQVDPTSKEYRDMILIAPNHIESGTGKIIGKETAIQQAAISGKYFAKLGAVILSKIRPNLAKVCMADQDCLTSADMYPLTAMSRITPAYLKQVLLSKRFTHYATESSVRGNIPKINREELGGYKFALPPLDEQMTITAGIESIETIIFKEEERVGLLLGLKNSLSSDLLSGRKRVSV